MPIRGSFHQKTSQSIVLHGRLMLPLKTKLLTMYMHIFHIHICTHLLFIFSSFFNFYFYFYFYYYLAVPYNPVSCFFLSQMTAAAQYHITTESIMLSRDEKPTISGMTGEEFQQRLTSLINTDPANTGGFPEAPLAYDAVW